MALAGRYGKSTDCNPVALGLEIRTIAAQCAATLRRARLGYLATCALLMGGAQMHRAGANEFPDDCSHVHQASTLLRPYLLLGYRRTS